ncbi:MAG: MaoC/PaaZ C-terminal domain-containing protein [Pseudomonadota bacterium]
MPIDYEAAKALVSTDQAFSHADRDTMLYALGIGLGADPMNTEELPFVYENGLRVVPTQATVMAWGAGQTMQMGINFMMVVHGEQRLTVHKTLPSEGDILADWSVDEIVDKGEGKGAVIYNTTVLKEAKTGETLATLGSTIFARADGGFGGPSEGGTPVHQRPDREADRTVSIDTAPDQALIYRLSGDRNPLHSDPEFAKMAGFDRPILHGLCTYGVCCRAILQAYCDYDPTRIKQFDVRFSAPVFPGETIDVDVWEDGDVLSFEARVAARGATVIKNGKCVLG